MPKVNITCRLCKNGKQYRSDNFSRHIKKIHGGFLNFLQIVEKETDPLKKCTKLHRSDSFQLQELYGKFKRKGLGSLDIRKFGTSVIKLGDSSVKG